MPHTLHTLGSRDLHWISILSFLIEGKIRKSVNNTPQPIRVPVTAPRKPPIEPLGGSCREGCTNQDWAGARRWLIKWARQYVIDCVLVMHPHPAIAFIPWFYQGVTLGGSVIRGPHEGAVRGGVPPDDGRGDGREPVVSVRPEGCISKGAFMT